MREKEDGAGGSVLVTGVAGFIGFHLARRLLDDGKKVFGIDSINNYYSVKLKKDRLAILCEYDDFHFTRLDIGDRRRMEGFFKEYEEGFRFARVVHLAAQAGVRYSIVNPHAYVKANLVGFTNILEGCRHSAVEHLVYASSSSVYGANTKLPFSVRDRVDHPVSLYAATKKANELMAHTYSSLYNVPTTGLRFFTVYGPYGRPDMALFKFTKAILDGRPVDVYNMGHMQRDFTYIDDIVEGIVRVMDHIPGRDDSWSGDDENPAISYAPYQLFNIGNNNPVELTTFIEAIERRLGRKARRILLPLQPGDVPATYADVDDLVSAVGFKPSTSVQDGIDRFIDWYLEYYGKKRPVARTARSLRG